MPPVSLSVLLHALCAAAWARLSAIVGMAMFLDAIRPRRRAGRPLTQAEQIELQAQLEQAHFVRVQLDALELELQSPDPDTRAAAKRRLRELDPFAWITALVLACVSACAPTTYEGALNVHVGQGDLAGERAPAPMAPKARVQLAPELEPDPILSLPAARCVGPWADNSDVRTRFIAHPDTQLCAFRCAPEHTTICDELGGVCEPASDGRVYCGGRS